MTKAHAEYPRTETGHADWKQLHYEKRTGKGKAFKFLSREVYFDPKVRALTHMERDVFYYGLQQVDFKGKGKGQRRSSAVCTIAYFPCEALKELGLHKASRDRALKKLIKVGLIERLPKPDDNNHKSKTYRMLLY